MPETMNLKDAANYLHLHEETLRRLAASGHIPAAKPGKSWVFIKPDITNWLRTFYRQSTKTKEANIGNYSCHSKSAVKHGGSTSLPPMESELDALLRQQ